MIVMRMDRYEDKTSKKNLADDNLRLSRLARNKAMYDGAYATSTVVDFEDFFNDNEVKNQVDNSDNIEKNEEIFEEKNYDIEEYLKKAHNNSKPDENIRNLDNREFKDQESEILKLIASIDEQKENDNFFGDLIGDDEDTMIEGQLTTEEFTKTTYEEFYETEVNSKKINDESTKLEKALSEATLAKLELEEESINNTFQDIFKTGKMSKKKKKKLAIIFFLISLFALIAVILFIIFR